MDFAYRLIAVLICLWASPSHSADLRLPQWSTIPAATAPDTSWTGFYVGGNGGYQWLQPGFANMASAPGPCTATFNFPGCLAVPSYSITSAQAATFGLRGNAEGGLSLGGQFGYTWQINAVIAGVEADFQHKVGNGSIASSAMTATANSNWPSIPVLQTAMSGSSLPSLGTLRARFGILVAPTVAIYTTAGLAFGSAKANASVFQMALIPGVPTFGGASGQYSAMRAGYTLGAGIEWAFLPRWSLKAEYVHFDLGRVSYATGTVAMSPNPAQLIGILGSSNGVSSTRLGGQSVRIGVNYHFTLDRLSQATAHMFN